MLVVHSDQGSQYTATRFKDLVAKHGALQSMSRRGNCYDNAHVEPFWSRFKAELLDGGSFPGLAEAKLEISHHLAYYNAERRHSALAYQAPNHFEALGVCYNMGTIPKSVGRAPQSIEKPVYNGINVVNLTECYFILIGTL